MTYFKEKIRNSKHIDLLIKFGATGALGTILNLILFFIFVDVSGLPAIPGSILCFVIAATQNYYINHYWTFSNNNNAVTLKNWFKYLLAAIAGLLVNLVILKLTINWFDYLTFSQLLGILCGFLINFIVARIYVFKA